MGVSHLLEHMVFKGTERRSAKELALELEVAGRHRSTPTPARDHTSYQAHVLDADLPLAVESSPTSSAGRCCARATSSSSAR